MVKLIEKAKTTINHTPGDITMNFGNVSQSLEAGNAALDQVIKNLKQAIKKDPMNKALLNAIKDFTIISEGLKSNTDNVNNNIHEIISSPIKNLAEHLEKNTPIGKLKTFVTAHAEKAQEKLSSIGENKIIKAAWVVALAVCEVIKVTINGAINYAIANGKLATSVKDFGVTVSSLFQQNQPPTRGR